MPFSKSESGIMLDWGAEHKNKEGKLISRQVMVKQPEPIECVKPSCLIKYTLKSIIYVLILLYHEHRVKYAEKHRNEDIPDKYRTGEYAPTSFKGLIWETIKLGGK